MVVDSRKLSGWSATNCSLMVMVDSCRVGSDLIVTSRQRNSTPDTVVAMRLAGNPARIAA